MARELYFDNKKKSMSTVYRVLSHSHSTQYGRAIVATIMN